MDILGIGPLEFLFILLIALIVLGPKDMVKAGRTIGRTLRKIVSSDTWRVVQQASREIRNLPNRLMREAGIEEMQRQFPDQRTIKEQLGIPEIEKSLRQASADLSDWTTPPPTIHPPQKSAEIAPPVEHQGGADSPPPSQSGEDQPVNQPAEGKDQQTD